MTQGSLRAPRNFALHALTVQDTCLWENLRPDQPGPQFRPVSSLWSATPQYLEKN